MVLICRSYAAPTNYSNTMKTTDSPLLQADPVISEVRRAKVALAAKHNFDVTAMVRSLQERERLEKCEEDAPSNDDKRPSGSSCP